MAKIVKPNLSLYRPLEQGESLEIGDVMHRTNLLCDDWYQVTRVTKTVAFVLINDTYETKFNRLIVGTPDFLREKASGKWSTTYYKAYRKK